MGIDVEDGILWIRIVSHAEYDVSAGIGRHVLQRRSQSVSVASEEEPRASLQAELTVYPSGEGDSLAAIYFDNEGHVIHYNHVIVTPGQQVQFLQNGEGNAPGFRLTYSLKASGVLHVTFEMAPPGQSSYRLIAEADETATH